MATTLAQVLTHFGPDYLRRHRLRRTQERAWRAIVACRTRALGGQQWRCEACAASQWRWHSCRSRYCPQCQSRARDAWRTARLAELLNVPYCHLVFTLPHELNPLASVHPHWVYDTLLRCTAATLTEFAANPRWLGGMGAFTLVLHTWTQDLRQHPHVHALMACGALQPAQAAQPASEPASELASEPASGKPAQPACWISPKRAASFLFPVHALSQVFRGKVLDALQLASAAGQLSRDPANTHLLRDKRLAALRRHDWVVYAKTPLAGPAAVLDYLARYTHRTAISNERLIGIDAQSGTVRLRVRADANGGKRSIALPGEQFIGRFLQHVLPQGFKRIRHYGLLAPTRKTQSLAQARQLLAMPAANPIAREDAQAFMQRVANLQIERCTHCGTGKLHLVQTWPADTSTIYAHMARAQAVAWAANRTSAPAQSLPTACRGPP
jgi:hypothetical protein